MSVISFIIPVYNGEKYLQRMLDSILYQNVSTDLYEVILVDDCSFDHSVEIIERYKSTFTNIKILKNKINSKVGTTCNNGLKEAIKDSKGYIWIMGQDDELEPNILSEVIKKISLDDLDVFLFNFRKIDSNNNHLLNYYNYGDWNCKSGIEFIKDNLYDKFIHCLTGYTWQSVIKKNIIIENNLFFPEKSMYEDTTFLMKAVIYSKRVASTSKIYYNYRLHNDSLVHAYSSKGNIIYEFAFIVGNELEECASLVKKEDISISQIIKKRAILYYNNFILPLILTSIEEKRSFYRLIRNNYEFINSKKIYLNKISRLLLSLLGFYLSVIMKPCYIVKKKIKKIFIHNNNKI